MQLHVVRAAENLMGGAVFQFEKNGDALSQASPEHGMGKIGLGLIERGNRVALCHGAEAKARDLRENEPHPVRRLATRPQFGNHLRKHRFLRLDEAFKVIKVFERRHLPFPCLPLPAPVKNVAPPRSPFVIVGRPVSIATAISNRHLFPAEISCGITEIRREWTLRASTGSERSPCKPRPDMKNLLVPGLLCLAITGCTSSDPHAPIAERTQAITVAPQQATGATGFPPPPDCTADPACTMPPQTCRTVGAVTTCDAPPDPLADSVNYTN